MKISVEISMYPLTQDYIPPIKSFIEALNTEPNVECRTNGMSTQIFGEYDVVMALLQKTMKSAMNQEPKVIFVTKFLSADASEYKGT